MIARHVPVMKAEVLSYLSKAVIPSGCTPHFIDGCAGFGGHSVAILDSFSNANLLCIDRDPSVKEPLATRLKDYASRVRIVTNSYAFAEQELEQAYGVSKANGVLLDLGFNSMHVDDADRGFSFQKDGVLDMRYDQGQEVTAADLINSLDKRGLVSIFAEYSGESLRTCKHVANTIVHRREQRPFQSTLDLADCMNRALSHDKHSARTPCTGLFQALRIAVNREFDHLDAFMDTLPSLLEQGGVAVFLCFHSLEVKRLKRWVRWYLDAQSPWRASHPLEDNAFTILTPKPVLPTKQEIEENHRSRSTVLYSIQRTSCV